MFSGDNFLSIKECLPMSYFSEEQVRRNVSLEVEDWEYVKKVANEKGLGRKGLSAALRLIIHDHAEKEKRESIKKQGS